ncbi:hypothetical protein [Novosphingobium sp. ZW T3_23]|uniref:hypothetical protein n=1 Tax=Novosphingobium sp. ZW T3_23 TaxID=3378084 RepID=UPI003853FC51
MIITTFFAAGIVKDVTGMGLPTVAMGVLGSLLSPLVAAALLLVPSFGPPVPLRSTSIRIWRR